MSKPSDVACWCVIKQERKHAVSKLNFRFCNYFMSCFSSIICCTIIAASAVENISNSRKPHPPIWSVLELHGDLMHMQMLTQLHPELFQLFNKPTTIESDQQHSICYKNRLHGFKLKLMSSCIRYMVVVYCVFACIFIKWNIDSTSYRPPWFWQYFSYLFSL